MISLITEIPAFILLSSLGNLSFTTDQAQATVTLSCGSTQILSETFIPDKQKNVTIYALSDLLEPSLSSNPMAQFTLTVNDGSTLTRTFYVLFSRALVSNSFVEDFFLSTSLTDVKYTFPEATELLFLSSGNPDATSSIAVSAEVTYWNESTQQLQKSTRSVGSVVANKVVGYVDVSPRKFASGSLRLVSYTVYAGNRVQSFKMMWEYERPTTFVFRNLFGCMEYVHLFGTKEIQHDITRLTAVVNHRNQIYKALDYPSWTVKSGYTDPVNMRIMQDLLASDTVQMFLDSTPVDVIITDHKTTISDDMTVYPELELTVQQVVPNRKVLNLPSTGIFDETFDDTFN